MTTSAIKSAYQSLLQRGRLIHDPLQARLADRLSILQQQLSTSSDSPLGLYVHGGVGTGKTRIVDLFSSTLPASISRRRCHYNDFMLDVHNRLHIARSQSHASDSLLEIGNAIAGESRVLVFDEFQVTDIADAMILRRLFHAIWSAGGVMVSTSNRRPDDLYENGLNRPLFVPFIHDLKRRCEIWPLEGQEDYRMKSGSEARVMTFFIDKEQYEAAVQGVVMRCNQHLRMHYIEIPGNRTLGVQGIEDDSGMLKVTTTFDQLCKSDRGASDYIALCGRCREIYMDGLRSFRSDELDLVRRFITLIDVAYERRIRVTCLSDVPLLEVFANIVTPGEIQVKGQLRRQIQDVSVRREGGASSSMASTYIGETEWSATGLSAASLATGGAGERDVRFAVGRAISRLYEMGSRDYARKD